MIGKTLKRIVCGVMSVFLVFGASCNVKAAEISNPITKDTKSSFSLSRNQMSSEQIEQLELILENEETAMKVGECKVAVRGVTEADTLYVELVSEKEDNTRASLRTTSKYFNFYRQNALGIKVSVVGVDMKCTWILDGVDSIIDNLVGTYTIKESGASCKWSGGSATNTVHTLWLDITYLGSTGSVLFGAYLSIAGTPTVDLSCNI